MTYNKNILAKIGRQVIEKHPLIATMIMDELPMDEPVDLNKLTEYFTVYCIIINRDPESLRGRVYKSSATELKKIFIASMLTIYKQQYQFHKTISLTLDQDPSHTTRMINEVKFRYRKELEFQTKVNNILNKIINYQP